MAHPVKTTVPVGAVVGGLIGAGFDPWWMWSAVGVVAGVLYAAILTLVFTRLMRWLRGGSADRYASVTVGGWMGAITAGLAGAIAATGWFPPPTSGESARLFATGMIGLFACWPVGFAVGGFVAGLLVAFYEWFDTRYATPLREKSAVVDQATKVGLGVGAAGTGVIVLVFGVSRSNRYRPVAPDWIALPVG